MEEEVLARGKSLCKWNKKATGPVSQSAGCCRNAPPPAGRRIARLRHPAGGDDAGKKEWQ